MRKKVVEQVFFDDDRQHFAVGVEIKIVNAKTFDHGDLSCLQNLHIAVDATADLAFQGNTQFYRDMVMREREEISVGAFATDVDVRLKIVISFVKTVVHIECLLSAFLFSLSNILSR